jgi:hypothetical protein
VNLKTGALTGVLVAGTRLHPTGLIFVATFFLFP